jgi:nucleoside-diphosphate-sugar epimerase
MIPIKKILVTGGAGYIGSVLVRLLLKHNYKVRVLDSLLFGGESIVELLNDINFEFVKGDVRDEQVLKIALKNVDAVANLAAIVGDPSCAKQPELAREINFEAAKTMYNIANMLGVNRFIFASTCSNYGKMEDPDTFVDENSKLAPVSLYAETKVATENFLLNQPKENRCKPTCLRFSTVYGLSPRMRFDLTVNEFTKELALGRELMIFGEQFWRPYSHVVDLSRSVLAVIEARGKKVDFNVFNVGNTNENYTKKMLVEEIVRQLPGSKVKYIQRNDDPRDYKVSFKKINEILGFETSRTVPEEITQIIKVVKEGFFKNPDDDKFRNC